MSGFMHYPKAPIIEAVLDLQVLPSENFDLQLFDKISNELSENFKSKNIDEAMFELQFGQGQNRSSQAQRRVGIRLESNDNRYVIQAKQSGYSFSIVNYYDCWGDFSEQAYRYWDVYKNLFGPQKIVRQALRYINRIDVPETSFELKKYFNIYPYIFDNDSSPETVGFFMQAQISQKEGGVANITQAVTQPAKPGCTSIILDIDVLDHKQYKPESDELKSRISKLRDQKNTIFESAITDATKELIS